MVKETMSKDDYNLVVSSIKGLVCKSPMYSRIINNTGIEELLFVVSESIYPNNTIDISIFDRENYSNIDTILYNKEKGSFKSLRLERELRNHPYKKYLVGLLTVRNYFKVGVERISSRLVLNRVSGQFEVSNVEVKTEGNLFRGDVVFFEMVSG